MIYICVSGYGGTGKSELCKKINAIDQTFIHISVDDIIEKYIIKNPYFLKYMKNIFKKTISLKTVLNACFFNDEENKKIHKTFINYLDKCLLNIINSLNQAEVIPLIDWFACEKLNLFNKANYKILMIADKSKRINRVIDREHKKYEDALKVETTVEYKSYSEYNIVINTNNFDFDIKNIIEEIKRGISYGFSNNHCTSI